MTDSQFESRLAAFEQHWLHEGPCNLAAFLDQQPALTSESRRRLLLELICIDLEFRWRDAGEAAPGREIRDLEAYLADFPEVGVASELPIELIAQEYRVRHRWGDRPKHAEFLLRFGSHTAGLEQALCLVDKELIVERTTTSFAPNQTPMPPERSNDAQLEDIPLLSYRDFLLRRMIGAGRVGKVYEALQQSTGRTFAVKFLRKSFLANPSAVARFVAEARIIARLRHEHIIGIEGLGVTPGGGYFLAIELVRGPNLDARLKASPVPISAAVRWTIELCEALGHAHAHGVVHCDLKPANLLLDPCGRLKVTDFGLARDLNAQTPEAPGLEGTAPFMAPEQVSRHFGAIDERTDIYGAGAVLYTLLTGRPPWLGTRLPDVLAQVISAATPRPPHCLRPDVPEILGAVCMKCLSKRKEDRFRTTHELSAAIQALAASVHAET